MTRALAACGLLAPDGAAADMGGVLGDASRHLEAFACARVVLDATVSTAVLTAWLPQLGRGAPAVAAVHAPCPAPETARSDRRFAAADLRPASPDAAERAEALALLRPALDTAAVVEARTVVLEGGALPLGSAVARLETAVAAGTLAEAPARLVAEALRDQRAQAGAAAVDGWCFTVEALLPAVEERGLVLALAEQRGLAWAGSVQELARVLERFAGAPVTWWADPVGRREGTRLLGEWGDGRVPPAPAAGVWWRVPQVEADWDGAGVEAEAGAAALHVLAPTGGTLRGWHHGVWSALDS